MSDPVLELIQKNGLGYQVSGRDYLIKCLNPEHPDSNPSFRVDRVSGVAHCFACGFKTNLFKYYGVFTNPVPVKIAQLKEKLAVLKSFGQELELPQGYTPWTKTFRGVSPATLKHFKMTQNKNCYHSEHKESRTFTCFLTGMLPVAVPPKNSSQCLKPKALLLKSSTYQTAQTPAI